MLTSTEKSALPGAQRRFKPMRLHHTGQWTQHTTDLAIPAPKFLNDGVQLSVCQTRGKFLWCQAQLKCALHITSPCSYCTCLLAVKHKQLSICSCRNVQSLNNIFLLERHGV